MKSIATFARRWSTYLILVHAVFLLRAIVLLAALPPFEGWDEYQHVAYIQFIIDHHRLPHPGDDVPVSLYEDLVKYPHPSYAEVQLRTMGAESYVPFWRDVQNGIHAIPNPVELYEAQHPPLYYILSLPVYLFVKQTYGLLVAISVLRAINVLIGLATITLFALILQWSLPDGIVRRLPLIILATQPLFLMCMVGVSNAPLAALLPTAGVALVLKGILRYPRTSVFGSGVLAGLGVLSKGIAVPVLVSLAPYVGWLAWRQRKTIGSIIAANAWLAAGAVIPLSFEVLKNLVAYGTPFPLKDVMLNTGDGKSAIDLWNAALAVDWAPQFFTRYGVHLFYVGGWTMLYVSEGIARLHRLFLYAAAGGLGVFFLRRLFGRAKTDNQPNGLNLLAWCVTIASAALLGIHMILLQAAYGTAAYTNVWYILDSIPWIMLLLVKGWEGYGQRWFLFLIGTAFVGLQLVVENNILFRAEIPYYTQTGDFSLSLERLSWMHPAWLSAGILLPAVRAAFVLAMVTCATTLIQPRPTPVPST